MSRLTPTATPLPGLHLVARQRLGDERGHLTRLFCATALAEARAQGILAKAVTPFLLDRIFTLTDGRSLSANIALVLNNARLGAAVATEITRARHA